MIRDGKTADTPLGLGEVSTKVAAWVHRLGAIWIEGQVVELRASRGYVWLTLRDHRGEYSMSVTMSQRTLDVAGPVPDGSSVVVYAKPSWWTKSGKLSLQATEIRPAGEGRLLAQIEQLKRRLQAEGLFEPRRKRPLPFLPRGIGVITAADSDAERDVYRQVHSRWPAAHIVTLPVAAQGSQCAEEVILALRQADADPSLDVIIVARGGGSMEDLLGFSDEGVIRAAAACTTPIISGIGHEKDSPVLDLVADVRASTPTDAGRRAVPDVADETRGISELTNRLRNATSAQLRRESDWLTQLRARPVFREPAATLAPHRERLAELRHQLRRAITNVVTQERRSLTHDVERARAMSPEATLQRGYSILFTDEGASITSVDDVRVGQQLGAYVVDGTLHLDVTAIDPYPQEES